jgi:hypothetical protein
MVRGVLLKDAGEAGTMTIDRESHYFCIHRAIARSYARPLYGQAEPVGDSDGGVFLMRRGVNLRGARHVGALSMEGL